MNLSVTLGDVIIAGSLAGSIFLAYQAMKGQLATIRAFIDVCNLRMDQQAAAIRRHGADIRFYGRRQAAVEGKVFGRRIDDRAPSERDGPVDDTSIEENL